MFRNSCKNYYYNELLTAVTNLMIKNTNLFQINFAYYKLFDYSIR